MNESPLSPSRTSEGIREAKRAKVSEYDDRAASSRTRRRVGVYDRPEGSSVRSGSMMSIVVLLLAVLIAVYFLFVANHFPS
jgi:hypothetical protein